MEEPRVTLAAKIHANWKVYVGALFLATLVAIIGPISIPTERGAISFAPSIVAIIVGAIFGPDLLKFFTEENSRQAGLNVPLALAPFMVKLGISAGANLAKLVEVGPALILQEFGNLGTIMLSLPLALLLGIKRESIGACHSIDRDANLALVTDLYGPVAPETRGVYAVYITGSVLGTVFISLFASIVASWDFFNPLALGMASGVGSASMMSMAASTVADIYPECAEEIVALAGTSDMLTGITGIYMATFIALPFCTFLYNRLEPKIGRFWDKKAKGSEEEVK